MIWGILLEYLRRANKRPKSIAVRIQKWIELWRTKIKSLWKREQMRINWLLLNLLQLYYVLLYVFYCLGSIVRARKGKQTKPATVIEISQTINLAIDGMTESNPFSCCCVSLIYYYEGVSASVLELILTNKYIVIKNNQYF